MRHFTTHFTNAIEADSACGPSHGQVRGLRREMLVHWSDADSALCTLGLAAYPYSCETERIEGLFRRPAEFDSWAGRCQGMSYVLCEWRLLQSNAGGGV
jgi:hypothetical protein